jgi:hypothetical protein
VSKPIEVRYIKPTVFERLDEVTRELHMKEFDDQITIALLHAIEEATRLEPSEIGIPNS